MIQGTKSAKSKKKTISFDLGLSGKVLKGITPELVEKSSYGQYITKDFVNLIFQPIVDEYKSTRRKIQNLWQQHKYKEYHPQQHSYLSISSGSRCSNYHDNMHDINEKEAREVPEEDKWNPGKGRSGAIETNTTPNHMWWTINTQH